MRWPWPFHRPPRLDWLQVEISTHCNAACLYCPRTCYASRWQNRLLAPELFAALRPLLATTRLLYLQGWGEPLTHPAFFDFVDQAKAAGCAVGTTTNGLLLTEECCRRLIASQVDVVALSLAGVDQENDRIRRGTSVRQVLAAIERLDRLKHALTSDTPAIHIAYLLLRSRLDDVEALPALLAGRGIGQVVISTLDLVADHGLLGEAIVPANEVEYAALRQRLDAVIAAGAGLSLPIHAWLARPAAGLVGDSGTSPSGKGDCSENIDKAAVIAVDGSLSPCVYTHLPLAAGAHVWTAGQETPFHPLVFGSVAEQSFAALWHAPAYAAFRRAHRSGRPPLPCRDCVRMRMRSG